MRKLLNTLYVFTEGAYLSLENENVVVWSDGAILGRVPLHTVESILCFSYKGASPQLMGSCAEKGISLSFFSPHGKYLASVYGRRRGNVLLRRSQYEIASDGERSLEIARNFIAGKVFNGRWVIERGLRDHALRVDADTLRAVSSKMKDSLSSIEACRDLESLRGVEGEAAARYFSVFDQLILRDKETFAFRGRVRRPPTDPVNAMLSLFYAVLAADCSSALEGVGLDPYIGFMHVDRPGRASLALDLIEELRAVMVDRFVLTSINNRIVSASSFEFRESGEVRLTDKGRRALFDSWQSRKRETIVHPYLKEKISWGLLPHVQALLLARCVRGDLDGYPPFLWK